MKKRKHSGFSMVEIIVVIAIMAIIAAALAPALIKYIGKSRRTRDVDTAKEIQASYMRAAVEMEKESTGGNLGSGSALVRYDTVLNSPPQTLEDYAFAELGGVPQSATFQDYYWEIEYDPKTGQVKKIYLTPAANASDQYELYPDSEDFIEKK